MVGFHINGTKLSVSGTILLLKSNIPFSIFIWDILCLTKHHAMKKYWGSGSIASCIFDLGTRGR
jgi:hypothetical protein